MPPDLGEPLDNGGSEWWSSLPRFVTAPQVATYLQVHVGTVYRYARDGVLPPHRVPGSRAVRFRKVDVDRAYRREDEEEDTP